MVLSGCHSFSDTCSERQLPCPLLLRHLSAIYPSSLPKLASGPLSFRDPGGFWLQRTLGVLSPNSLEGARREPHLKEHTLCHLKISCLCGLGKTA